MCRLATPLIAFTVKAEKRLSSKLTFLAVYTRSKAIDDVRTPLDIYNRRLEKGLSTFDTPNQFRLSGVYNIPFGRDRDFGKTMNRVVNALIADWDLSGILSLQSGLPVSIGRPAVNNGQSAHLDNPTVNRWFNTSDFTVAAPNHVRQCRPGASRRANRAAAQHRHGAGEELHRPVC